MTVVLDSGIWISGLHFGGTPLAALDQAFLYDQIAICEEITPRRIGPAPAAEFPTLKNHGKPEMLPLHSRRTLTMRVPNGRVPGKVLAKYY